MDMRSTRTYAIALISAFCLTACGGGAPASSVYSEPFSFVLNEPAGPIPASTTYLNFIGSQILGGTPLLAGSDGSHLTGGNLSNGECLGIPGGVQCAMLASISGLRPATTYVVSFATLTIDPSGTPGPGDLPGRTVGSFTTQ